MLLYRLRGMMRTVSSHGTRNARQTPAPSPNQGDTGIARSLPASTSEKTSVVSGAPIHWREPEIVGNDAFNPCATLLTGIGARFMVAPLKKQAPQERRGDGRIGGSGCAKLKMPLAGTEEHRKHLVVSSDALPSGHESPMTPGTVRK